MAPPLPYGLLVGTDAAKLRRSWDGELDVATGPRAALLLAGACHDVVFFEAGVEAPPAALRALSSAVWVALGPGPCCERFGLPVLSVEDASKAALLPRLAFKRELTGEFRFARRLARYVHVGRETGTLHVSCDDGSVEGELYFLDGDLVGATAVPAAATACALFGEAAAHHVLTGKSGVFRLGPLPEVLAPAARLEGPTPQLLELKRPKAIGPYRVERFVSEGAWASEFHVVGPQGPARLVLRRDPGPSVRPAPSLGGVLPERRGGTFDGMPLWEEVSVPGPTLEQLVIRRGPLPLCDVASLGLELFDTLSQLHALGRVHGGLDPRRIVIVESGLAVLLDQATERAGPRRDFLTLRTTAPEVIAGGAPDSRSDIYSLGAILAYAASGYAAFPVTSPRRACLEERGRHPDALLELGALTLLVAQLMGVDPSARTQSARELRAGLLNFSEGEGSGTYVSEEGAPKAPKREPKVPGPIDGYVPTRLLGQGATSDVFAATPPDGGPPVALKLKHPVSGGHDIHYGRFVREAKIAAGLDHPNVVRVLGSGRQGDVLYLVMELVEGAALDAVLATEGRIEPQRLEVMARQVLAALGSAHAAGVVHRDIKPGNLIVTQDEVVKVADFGIARSYATGVTALTRPGTMVGTPLYMSPEQCRGGDLDARSDLYSLGATLYHLVSATAPFDGMTAYQLVEQHMLQVPKPIRSVAPDVSERFAAVITRLLAKQPASRFPDAASVIKALDA